ncbi:MAG: hypothetical protein LBE91_05885, partial [Tannerella sp.]|nr:hypothetical protein [Tannerella sp.]
MKKNIILIVLIFIGCSCQGNYNRNKETKTADTLMFKNDIFTVQRDNNKEKVNLKNDTVMDRNYERFDFEAAEKYATEGTIIKIKIGDTVRVMNKSEKELDYTDFLPASDFHEIVKFFHLNGNIKSKANFWGSVRFGIYEEYDENGYCIKKVNEDEKFGKIKREDIIRLLEKEGWFNRKTGENKVADESPLKTDGTFYREIMRYMSIGFIKAKYDVSGKETEPPKWIIVIEPGFRMHVTEYTVNGNTGEWKMRKY